MVGVRGARVGNATWEMKKVRRRKAWEKCNGILFF
jgi:hypothetical protein